tara:strand:+ start:304 stop:591 length:288 start_codon:yes stop_codon:yes gene_type:complete
VTNRDRYKKLRPVKTTLLPFIYKKNSPVKILSNTTYHIYLKDQCLFKDLSQDEFDIIWGRIYRSYFTEDISYTKVALGGGVGSGTLPEPPGSDSY